MKISYTGFIIFLFCLTADSWQHCRLVHTRWISLHAAASDGRFTGKKTIQFSVKFDSVFRFSIITLHDVASWL